MWQSGMPRECMRVRTKDSVSTLRASVAVTFARGRSYCRFSEQSLGVRMVEHQFSEKPCRVGDGKQVRFSITVTRHCDHRNS